MCDYGSANIDESMKYTSVFIKCIHQVWMESVPIDFCNSQQVLLEYVLLS